MIDRTIDVDALVQDLSDFQKETVVEGLLRTAVGEPRPTEEKLHQVEEVLETLKGYTVIGEDGDRDLRHLLPIGNTYERFSHLRKACETYEAALDLAQKLEDKKACAMLFGRLGRVMSKLDRWEEALDYLDRSQKAFGELGDAQGQALALVGRGIVLGQLGRYQEAQEAQEKGLVMAERAGDRKILSNARNNLAVLATIRGDLDDAIRRYQECLATFQEAGDNEGLARTYHNLGMTHADRRDWGAAMQCYERGFEAAHEQGMLEVMANIHLSRAELLLELGDTSMVAICCARALDIYRKTGNRLGEAETYRLLGRLFTLRQRWSTALSLFKDSIRLNEEYSNPLNLAETHRDIGRMHAARGQVTDARASFEAAMSGFRKIGARADVIEVERMVEALDQT